MFHYIYKITNNINKKFYIGVRSSLDKPSDDYYMGSGQLLWLAYQKYGKENFTKEILSEFSSRDEADLEEEKLVNHELVMNPNSYNIALGGKYPKGVLGCIRVVHPLIGCTFMSLEKFNDFKSTDNLWEKGNKHSTEHDSFLVTNLVNNEYSIFASNRQAAKFLGCDHKGIGTRLDKDHHKYLDILFTKGRSVVVSISKGKWVGDNYTITEYGNTLDIQNNLLKIPIDRFNISEGYKIVDLNGTKIKIFKNNKSKFISKEYLDEYKLDGWVSQ